MQRYTCLLFHREKAGFLTQLMDLGLTQVVEHTQAMSAEAATLMATIEQTEDVRRRLRQRQAPPQPAGSTPPLEALPSLSDIGQWEAQLRDAQNDVEALSMEIALLEPWGAFDRQRLAALSAKAEVALRFYRHPTARFPKAWSEQYPLEVIRQDQETTHFVVFHRPDMLDLPLTPLALPDQSLAELRERHAQRLAETNRLNEQLDQLSAQADEAFGSRIAEAKDRLALLLAERQARPAADYALWTLEVWCPEQARPALEALLERERVVFWMTKSAAGDVPPVLLHNNAFARLFEPIGRQFSLPHPNELDLTALFSPFFLLFFGMCLGDAGYGLVLLTAGTAYRLVGAARYRDYAVLLQWFGASSAVLGFLSGAFFGIELPKMTGLETWRTYFLDRDALFQVALYLGFAQILFGMSIRAYREWHVRGKRYAFAHIGWILLLLALADRYVWVAGQPWSTYVMVPALSLIVFFSAPERGWLMSIGLGVANLYNITGVLGDLLSYIRLFALGVSGSILGLVVNHIATSALSVPIVGALLFVLVLLVGHTVNLLLCCLSGLVHPMRLTFVEFYKNAGFVGGGKPFRPFARHSADDRH